MTNEGVVKLADFGASRKLAQLQSDMMMSLTMRGTPYFMAPEVFEEKYSTKADIWAVGCVAFQMVTGQPPWKNLQFTNPVSLFHHIKTQKRPPHYELQNKKQDGTRTQQKQFRAWMDKCYAFNPLDRPTANALLNHPFLASSEDTWNMEPSCITSTQTTRTDYYREETTCFGSSSPICLESSPIIDGGGGGDMLCCSPSQSCQQIQQQQQQQRRRRRNSLGGTDTKSPFLSPPLPKSNNAIRCRYDRMSSPPTTGYYHYPPPSQQKSPTPDMSAWPTWAKEKYISSSSLRIRTTIATTSPAELLVTNQQQQQEQEQQQEEGQQQDHIKSTKKSPPPAVQVRRRLLDDSLAYTMNDHDTPSMATMQPTKTMATATVLHEPCNPRPTTTAAATTKGMTQSTTTRRCSTSCSVSTNQTTRRRTTTATTTTTSSSSFALTSSSSSSSSSTNAEERLNGLNFLSSMSS